MKDLSQERAVTLGQYIVETGATVRETAKVFGISKSTVHKDVAYRLPYYHKTLAKQVEQVLQKNKNERHLRGGLATKAKYEKKKAC